LFLCFLSKLKKNAGVSKRLQREAVVFTQRKEGKGDGVAVVAHRGRCDELGLAEGGRR
jgi:hypothetical protein